MSEARELLETLVRNKSASLITSERLTLDALLLAAAEIERLRAERDALREGLKIVADWKLTTTLAEITDADGSSRFKPVPIDSALAQGSHGGRNWIMNMARALLSKGDSHG